MAEQTGDSVAAVRARQDALTRQHSKVSDVDRVLAGALVSAHAATVEGLTRLEAIAQEIDSAVQNRAALAIDTPIGRREFHRFLIAKQREIIATVAHARELDEAKSAVLKGLRVQYAGLRRDDNRS
jgi:uncharacterized protein DUF4226